MTMTATQPAVGDAAWNDLIAEQAESSPGTYLQEGEVLSRGNDAEAPVPMRVSSLKYKVYVEVWDTQTGVSSFQPWWLLWQTMRKRREDGSLVFTRTNPNIPADYGADLFCPLHPEAPVGQRFGGKGFKACKKKHIPHWDGLQRHIRKSHGRAWEAMERERTDRERVEDRALQREAIQSQREFMQVMMQNAAGAPQATLQAATATFTSGGAATAVVTAPERPARAARVERTYTKTCEVCGVSFEGSNGMVPAAKLRAHMKREHAET